MKTFILILSFLTSTYVMAAPPVAPQVAPGAPCVDQGYADPLKEPNYDCRGPGEDMLVPDTPSQPSIGVPAETQAPAQKWDGVLLDRIKVMELGLRIKAIRRLRWLDLHKSSDLLAIEQKYLRDTSTEKDKLAQSQVASYREQLVQTQAELSKSKAWYRSWTFGLVVGVVLTSAAVAGVAIAIRK